MKKAIVLFLILVLTVSMLCFSAAAEEAEEYTDSSGNIIPEEVVELANLQEGDTLHEFYALYSLQLEPCTSLEEILASPSRVNNYRYFVWQDENHTQYRLYRSFNDGRPAECYKVTDSGQWGPYTIHNLILSIDPEIAIDKAYYFINPITGYDSFFYFQTNLGDFVYFVNSYSHDLEPQVTTAEDFFHYLYARQFYRETGLDLFEGGDAGDVVWVYVVFGTLFAAWGVAFFISRKKKKEEMETIPVEDV